MTIVDFWGSSVLGLALEGVFCLDRSGFGIGGGIGGLVFVWHVCGGWIWCSSSFVLW